MPRKTPPPQDLDLQSLIARIQSVNPTGRGLRRSEERARYAEKAHLQSLLVENHPQDVRVRIHDDMPGIVSLSIPRLQASAGHAVVDTLSSAARHWIESRGRESQDLLISPSGGGRSRKTTGPVSFIDQAERHLTEYDFECAIHTLEEGIEDSTTNNDECICALLLLLEIHVDHLANHEAALEIEAELRNRGGLSERAHELLGIAASRATDIARALQHLLKCRGERVGLELATIARLAAKSSEWAHARKAWMHLNLLATNSDPSLGKLRNEVRDEFVQQALGKPSHEIEADPELGRFVREFGPRHPWLLSRREQEQKNRLESSVRNALQKAREAKAAGHFEEISLVLETIPEQSLSSSEALEISELRAWAEERRVLAQATRILSLAQAHNFDAACHAYVSASPRIREIVQERGTESLFTTLEYLNEVFPERTNSRAHLRAALAWAQASSLADETSAWSILTPHLMLLEVVPALSPALNELRNRVRAARARIETLPGKAAIERHDECVEGDCFAEWIGRALDLRPKHIARQALRIGADWYIATLSQTLNEPAWILSLWPTGRSAVPRHVQIRELDPAWSLRIVTQKQRVVISSDEGSLWLVDFARGTSVRRIPSSFVSERGAKTSIVALDDEHCAIRLAVDESANETWQIVHVVSGVVRAKLQEASLYCVRSMQGATLYRANRGHFDRLDVNGNAVDRFEMPKDVLPRAVVEIPAMAHPVVIATAIVRSCVLAWWSAQPGFFRSFELFDINDHGQFLEAWAIANRGMFVLTQRSDRSVYLHEALVTRGVLRPGRRRKVNYDSCSMVFDVSGRRAWVVRTTEAASLEIHDASTWFEQS